MPPPPACADPPRPRCPLAGHPPAHTLLFDLDDTLYRVDEFPDLVRQRIEGEKDGIKKGQQSRLKKTSFCRPCGKPTTAF